MKKTIHRIFALVLALLLIAGIVLPVANASEVTDDPVQAVIDQLNAIDTLARMQEKRYTFSVKNAHYDTGTTSTAVIEEHDAARNGYEAYLTEMFSARAAAQQAYDALTEEQKAQIDPALVAKLDNDLPTVINTGTFPVTPADDAYTFETVKGGTGYGYEVSHYMVSGNIPQTFILVDTSDGATSWTPSGLYEYGVSNYDVAYCCDVLTGLEYNSDYKRVNLEDSGYYGVSASQHIRAILQNAYPFVSMEQMKANLKAGGLSAAFVDSLNRADLISAVQMAVWTFANAADGASGGLNYFASIDVTKNQGTYFFALHDYTNEMWEWFPSKRQRSYDARDAYRVNTLAYYLCNLPGVPASDNQIVISDIEITRAEMIPGGAGAYAVGMYIYLNHGGQPDDDLKVIITSYDDAGEITEQIKQNVNGRTTLDMFIKANPGDSIKVEAEGTQTLARGVYFYEPEGGRDSSQSLVGVGEGTTRVHTEKSFRFEENVAEMGLRIYKTETETGSPLSDITFRVYRVQPGEGETVSPTPTQEEIARYAVAENLAGSVVTDVTGYASLALEEGLYLVVEEHNTEMVKAPVDPFYISIPMSVSTESEDGTTTVDTVNIVSVYPKNEPVLPPEEPPVIPPTPDNVSGFFEIVKYNSYDENQRLAGAEFAVYRAVASVEEATDTVVCDGIQYAVAPVYVNGAPLVLTTDENGTAVSPELPCDTYYLVETKAPAGFNLLTEAVKVTVRSSEMTTVSTVEIPNEPGSLLPETGGMGTRLFLILGSTMMAAAAVLLVTGKRMRGVK